MLKYTTTLDSGIQSKSKHKNVHVSPQSPYINGYYIFLVRWNYLVLLENYLQ